MAWSSFRALTLQRQANRNDRAQPATLSARRSMRRAPFSFGLGVGLVLWITLLPATAEVPVKVVPVTAPRTMVVAGHPEAAEAGAAILRAGGNAIDAAVAVSLSLGVAEPYGSGMGGKLMLLYYDAKTGQTHAIDGMDQASWSVVPADYVKRPEKDRADGWGSVCTPGLPAALDLAHAKWGRLSWAKTVRPAIDLAKKGFTVLPKTRVLFEERLDKLRGQDGSLAKLFLPNGELPAVGTRLPNPALARTMEAFSRQRSRGFYRGNVARELVEASRRGGGLLTLEDFARYEARLTTPISVEFRGLRLEGGPPPTTGAALFFTILKALENQPLQPPLRTAENIDLVGRIWREVQPEIQRTQADSLESREAFETLVSPESISRIRAKALESTAAGRKVAGWSEGESVHASTTHFAVVDAEGNVVCATQSQSLHFGAGVVVAGVIMNDSMSNFSFYDPSNPNFLAPGRRSRSTIAPTLVLREGKPEMAIGIPGASRIPTALLQTLIDALVFSRPLEDAIGDTRIHWYNPFTRGKPDAVEAEKSLDPAVVTGLRAKGWDVNLPEEPGTGRHFGGINAIVLNPDGSRTGYADPRRSNAAVGN
ncbi:MAG TPA: gamma-glutamyltransferase family protein [Opitutaceae bacterium]|nr:gamma-glutamyltransferase family protein [Opitutaceae bacterium]